VVIEGPGKKTSKMGKKEKKKKEGQVLVVYTCNSSHSGGRTLKDCSLKTAQANSSKDPISKKNPSQKRSGGLTQGVGPEFKPQYCQKSNQHKP
jgi:hypothetical protein